MPGRIGLSAKGEDPRDLRRRKRDPLAEPIHRIGEALRVGGVQGRQTDLVDIGVGIHPLWHGVRAQAGRIVPRGFPRSNKFGPAFEE